MPNYNDYLKKVKAAESGGNPKAKNPYGSATGIYQFTEDTWNYISKKYKLGYSLEDRLDPKKQEVAVYYFTKENEAVLRPVIGRELDDTDKYLAHFLGAGGASKFFKTMRQNPNAPISSVMSERGIQDNKPVVFNKDGSIKTVKDIYNWAQEKMGKPVSAEKEIKTEEVLLPQPKSSEISYLTDTNLFSNFVPNKKEEEQQTLPDYNHIHKLIEQAQVQYVAPEEEQFQDGGTWKRQQARVKAEKDAKLRELLKNKDFVTRLEIEAQQRRTQKPTERTTSQIDATKTVKTNNPDKTSLTARNKTDEEIAEERQARIDAQTEANSKPFDWSNFRQSLAERSQATGDALRVSNEPNFFDDYLNPASMIGSMVDNLGQAPLRAQQEDSYMPYVTAVGTPLAVGAMAGIGANSTGQFVNNIANPLAGTGDLINTFGNKFLPNAYNLNPYAKTIETFNNPNSFYRQIDDETFREGIESGLIRGKQNVDKTRGESIINLNKSFGDDAYYKKGSLYSPQRADYIYEVNKGEEFFIPKVNNRTRGYTTENTPIRVSKTPIPLDEASIYQKDWLQGYKQLDNNISNPFVPLYRTQDEEFKEGGEKNSLWKNIRKNRGSGKKPTKEMLEQERKIKRKEDGGEIPISKDGVFASGDKPVIVPSNFITMENVNYPILGIDNLGNKQMMYPNQKYLYPGDFVFEIPQKR